MDKLTVTSLTRHVSVLRREIEELRHEATHDKLTGLGNRRLLEERTEGRGGFFVALDLDGFKREQDAHPDGHAHGDRILRSLARLLVRAAVGSTRVACRVGGDEFVIWCPSYREALRMRNVVHAWNYGRVTASAGIAQTLELADRRCYEAKRERSRPTAVRLAAAALRRVARVLEDSWSGEDAA